MNAFASKQVMPALPQQMAGPRKTHPEVASSDHPAEHAAEQFANQAVAGPLQGSYSPGSLLAKGAPPHIQRKALQGNASRGSAPGPLGQQIQKAKGGGSPLPSALRQEMGNALNADLGDVRIHTDERAASLSKGLKAKAFAYGNDIFFGERQFSPDSQQGRHLIAHELAHVMQQTGMVHRQPSPPSTAMTRQEFEQVMRDTYGVTTVTTGTQDELRTHLGIPVTFTGPLPGWTAWDPGASSEVYRNIVDSFAEVNRTFQGFPRVTQITFYNGFYRPHGSTYQIDPGVGADFGGTEMAIYEATTQRRKGLPIARSVASGTYANPPGIALSTPGDPHGAPVAYPSARESQMRIIIHELGHGIQQAATRAPAATGGNGQAAAAPDPTMIPDYMNAVGWATASDLYDMGVEAVRNAINSRPSTTPPAQYRITDQNWNDPNWVEQPTSEYMVAGGPTEDFADAAMNYVVNPTLLQSRSPRRYEFLHTRRQRWQTNLAQPQAPQQTPPQTPQAPQSAPPSLLPRLTPSLLPSLTPNPLQFQVPSLMPSGNSIDWGAIRGELNLRGAPTDQGMLNSAESAWMQSHRFYTGVLGMPPDAATRMTNRTFPMLLGGALTHDYPTPGESYDRSRGISTTILPVSDILNLLIRGGR